MRHLSLRLRLVLALLTIVVIVAAAVAAPRATPSLALLGGSTAAPNNAFTTAPDWTPPSVTAMVVALSSDTRTGGYLRQGSGFYVYATIADGGNPPSGTIAVTADVSAVATGQTAVPLVPGTYAFPSGGIAYGYRSGLLITNATRVSGAFTWSIRTVDGAGNVGTFSFQGRVSTTYGLAATANHVGTSCQAASGGQHDMELGYVAGSVGTEAFRTGPGPFDRVTFCSDTFTAGSTMPAGTTTVSLTYLNTSATKTCDMTVTLWRNGTALGSLLRTVPISQPRTTGSWVFPTVAATFANGDRLNLTVDYKAGNQCNGVTFFWNSPAAPSQLTTP